MVLNSYCLWLDENLVSFSQSCPIISEPKKIGYFGATQSFWFKARPKYEATDMKMIFYSQENKSHFYKKLHLASFGLDSFSNSEMTYRDLLDTFSNSWAQLHKVESSSMFFLFFMRTVYGSVVWFLLPV